MKILPFLFGWLLCMTAHAASFDCAKASTSVEQIICSDLELSSLDEQLHATYQQALADSADPAALRSAQRRWNADVKGGCQDKECLLAVYTRRIAQISGSASSAGRAPGNADAMAERSDRPDASIENLAAVPMDMSASAAGEAENQPSGKDQQSPLSAAPTQSGSLDEQAGSETSNQVQSSPAAADDGAPGDDAALSSPNGLSTLTLKVAGAGLLLIAALSMYLHAQGKLTIYSDYTDASVTALTPLIAFAVYGGAKFFEMQDKSALVAAMAVLVFAAGLIFVHTFRHNGVSIYFPMALITKLTIISLYYVLMAILLFPSGTTRRKGERVASFEARERREARERAALVAAATGSFIALSGWMCRRGEFTSFKRYLTFR
ncbi:lysozyme inhibitor LprI family protein [Noviherbaspirillum pedocola]|uniref:DUF1311 domain-containing protein n=1 Tax=Noviherbaspirillum pedocola TaxID=2801341 RepID=A0A934SYI2_9BURK|nr:lysozyme inhibitor LprI family protein [Noviherbaspirillum pedocola]MBK4735242.1 DUF1311 domain-containing protein [Noviherbaspirillum pedocola]